LRGSGKDPEMWRAQAGNVFPVVTQHDLASTLPQRMLYLCGCATYIIHIVATIVTCDLAGFTGRKPPVAVADDWEFSAIPGDTKREGKDAGIWIVSITTKENV
jgi:hypothetical protein